MADDPRPPYVRFESRSIEDRTATLEAGHFVGKEIHFAIVTPPGSKDVVEKNAEDWLRDSKAAAEAGRLPMEWVWAYEKAYEMFQKGLELPEDGTPILTWPAINKAQAETIIACNIRTVEHLAEANEPALQAMGMGAQALKLRAKTWLETASKTGKPAERIAALETELASAKAQIGGQADKIKELEARIELLSKEDA